MASDLQNQPLDRFWAGEDVLQPFTLPRVDVTGFTLRFSLAASPTTDPVFTADNYTAGGLTVTDAGGDGEDDAAAFEVLIPAAVTEALDPPDPPTRARTWCWDVWRVDAGSRQRLAGGTVRVYDPEASYP